MMSFLAWLALALWGYLLGLRGGFWRADQRLAEPTGMAPRRWPPVAALVPARDEAKTIGHAVRGLLDQDYPGPFQIIVIDDDSRDGTARVAARAAGDSPRLHVVAGRPLAYGWTGKTAALAQGLEQVDRHAPGTEYLLFTDADILHDPRSLRRLMVKALDDERDLVSLMVRLRCESAWEKILIPAFVFFFQKLYPFPWVNDSARPTAAAAGGCMLVRRTVLEDAGGLEAIRHKLIDDIALGALIQRRGRVWLGLVDTVHSLRPYDRLGDIWRMVTRSAFAQLNYSGGLLAVALFGLCLAYLVPPLALLFAGWGGKLAGLLAWIAMAWAYAPTLRLYGRKPVEGLLLPFAALMYGAMTADAARRYWMDEPTPWKGRRPVEPE